MRNSNVFSKGISYRGGGRLIVEELCSVAASFIRWLLCVRFTRKALPSLGAHKMVLTRWLGDGHPIWRGLSKSLHSISPNVALYDKHVEGLEVHTLYLSVKN